MDVKPAPLLNPGTMQPMTAEELEGVFCSELVKQELDDETRFFEIPEEIREYYKTYRPPQQGIYMKSWALSSWALSRRGSG